MAQAAPVTTRSPFIAQLLAPITAPIDLKAARAFHREICRELDGAWSLAYHRYHAANAFRSHCAHARRAAEIQQRRLNVPEAAAEKQAQQELIAAVAAIMLVPAPTIGALRLKQKVCGIDGGRPAWQQAIARDEARLT